MPTRRSFCFSVLSSGAALLVPTYGVASGVIPTYEPTDMQYDLSWLRQTLLGVGVDPFAYSSRDEFEGAFANALAESKKPTDAFSFGLRAMRVFATLNDGHCGVNFLPTISATRHAGLLGFPLDFVVRGERMFVGAQGDPRFPTGTEYISINGISVADLIRRCLPYVGAQTHALRLTFVNIAILSYLYATFPAAPSFEVAFKIGDSIVETTVAATTFAVRSAAQARFAAASEAAMSQAFGSFQPYSFSRLNGGRVGYIDYRSCEDEERFKSFLQSTFSAIKEQPVDAVIVDIRHNGGGDDELNVDLWDYLTDKPFTMYGSMVVKVSDLLKTHYGKVKYQQIYTDKAWDMPDGSLLKIPFSPQPPPLNPLRFNGPVYVLVGTATFSSAMECALAAKDFHLATLVGQETGEPVNSSGELYTGVSPRTGLSFHFPTKFFYGYLPRPMGQGVIPDVAIPEPSTVTSGVDPVLTWAMNHIHGENA